MKIIPIRATFVIDDHPEATEVIHAPVDRSSLEAMTPDDQIYAIFSAVADVLAERGRLVVVHDAVIEEEPVGLVEA